MKVVLFCGGFGMRLREYSDSIPKPMVNIGYRPILWHIMKYYAHYGHKDFILCLGWKANSIKEYFLKYDECMSNDFTMSKGGRQIDLIDTDIQDWNITFVDTGTTANIGERLYAVKPYLAGEEVFLANYADGLSDLHLPDITKTFEEQSATATFVSVRPKQTFHTVEATPSGLVQEISPLEDTDVWMNGGFFVFRQDIFDYLGEGRELVEEPFTDLISQGKLATHRHDGFWGCMDTFKEKQMLDDLWVKGDAPWHIWSSAEPILPHPSRPTNPARARLL